MTHAALKDLIRSALEAAWLAGKHGKAFDSEPTIAALSSVEGEAVAFDDWPEFHAEAMGCGLEDRGITDRYEAMRYGWDEALDAVADRIRNHEDTAPPPQQADERLQGGMPDLDRDALETVLAMAQAWSNHYATEIRPELFKLMPKPHSGHERAISRVSAPLATQPQQAGGGKDWRKVRADEIERDIGLRGMTAQQVFTQMRQLIATPPQPEAGGGATEAMVEAALDAFDDACVAEYKARGGITRVSFYNYTRDQRLSVLRAALTAALSTTPASGGEHG